MAGTMTHSPVPWYRQLWPWLLMLMPATALVGGVITFWLAATTNNSLVVDDYYREGRAINMQLARDRAAQSLGLAATLSRTPGGAELRLTGAAGAALPPFVTVHVLHATRSELDRTLTLAAAGGGLYRSLQELPLDGRWNVMIEDPDRTWRLTGSAAGFANALEIAAPRT
jgi:hypothetical protein